MSSAPAPQNPGGLAGSGTPQESGLQIVVALCAVIRVARAYDSGNQAFKTQIKNFSDVLKPVLEKKGEAVMVVVDGELYLNGTRIAVNSFSFRFHRTVVDSFKRTKIAGLRVSGAADPRELGRFFEILLDTQGPKGRDMVEACKNAGFVHTQPALYAHENEGAAGDDGNERGGKSGAHGFYRILHEAAGGASSGTRVTDVMQGVQSVLSPQALQSGVELRLAKRVVQPLVDAATSLEPVLVGLSTVVDPERDMYGHAANVAGVAVSIGYAFGLDRTTLADLGVAALFHDVGIGTIDLAPPPPGETPSDDDIERLRRHTIEGAKLLAATTTLNRTSLRSMRVALEHHVMLGGAGYPQLPSGWPISLLSRIVSVADCYVSLIGRQRRDGTKVTPTMALGMMLGPLQGRLEPPLLRALVQSIGFYPPGQGVELSDGTLAVAITPNRRDLARPHVMVLTNAERMWLPEDERAVHRPLPREMSIKRALEAAELPLDEILGEASAPQSDIPMLRPLGQEEGVAPAKGISRIPRLGETPPRKAA